MPKKFTVVQSLAELLDVCRSTPPFLYNETGNPDPNGSYIRLPDGKLSRVMRIDNSLAAIVTHSGQR